MGDDVINMYRSFHDRMMRTVSTRGIEYSGMEMDRQGIVCVVNYTALVDDGIGESERMRGLILRALETARGMLPAYYPLRLAVYSESAVYHRGGNVMRRYSAIVFRDQPMMNLWTIRMDVIAQRGCMGGFEMLCN